MRVLRVILLCIGLLQLPTLMAGEKVAAIPGLEDELSAESFERRDQIMAAQMGYSSAFEKVIAGATRSGDPYLWARGEFLLQKIFDLSQVTGNIKDAISAVEILAASDPKIAGKFPPLILAYSRWLAANLHLQTGDGQKAEEYSRKLGLIRSWRIIKPEQKVSGDSNIPNPQQDGKGKPSAWRRHDSRDPLGKIAIGSLFGLSPNDRAYLAISIKSPKDQEAVIRLGASGGARIWLNSNPVESGDGKYAFGLDQIVANIWLNRGENRLTLEFTTGENEGELCARITDDSGAAIIGLSFDTDFGGKSKFPRREQEPELKEKKLPDMGAVSVLTERISAESPSHRDFYYLGYITQHRNFQGVGEQLARNLFNSAAKMQPEIPIYNLALSRSQGIIDPEQPDRDDNWRKHALIRARSYGENEVAAATELAGYYYNSVNNLFRANDIVDEAIRMSSNSPDAAILKARILLDSNRLVEAGELLRKAVREQSSSPEARYMLSRLEFQSHNFVEALDLAEKARKSNRISEDYLSHHIDCLLECGRPEQAIIELQKFLLMSPYSTREAYQLADLLLARNEIEQALKVADQRLQDCPADAGMLEITGRCLHRKGKTKDAIACWEKAVAIKPSNQRIKKLLEMARQSDPEDKNDDYINEYMSWMGAEEDYIDDSDTVYLKYDRSITLNPNGTRKTEIHRIAKIITPNGSEDMRQVRIGFDEDYDRISIIKARVIKSDGQRFDASTYYRNRGSSSYAVVRMPELSVGDLVELRFYFERYRKDFFGDYFGDIHVFQRGIPIASSSLNITVPNSMKIYFESDNGAPKAVEAGIGKSTTYSWRMEKLSALDTEVCMPPKEDFAPLVRTSTFSNWDELAKWYWALVREQGLPDEQISKFSRENLFRGKTGEREKAEAIFRWVSDNVRNEEWAFGVHGFKPYSAGSIFTRRFGDCKDKSTLINVMAHEAGISAWPMLIYATSPSNNPQGRGIEKQPLPMLEYFNHCISALNADGEEYFLDATRVFNSFRGYHYTIAGGKGVVIRPEGAELIRIPPHIAGNNEVSELLRITLHDNGDADFSSELDCRGNPALYLQAYFGETSDETANYIMRRIASKHIGPAKNAEATYNAVKEEASADMLESRVSVSNYAKASGKTISLPIPPTWLRGDLKSGGSIPGELSAFVPGSKRKHSLVMPMVFRVRRQILIELPEGYKPAKIPAAIELKSDHARFEVKYSYIGRTVSVEHLLEISSPIIPVGSYEKFRHICLISDKFDASELKLEKK